MKIISILTLAVCCSFVSYGQTLLMGTELDAERYTGIEKSPYLFQDFAHALVIDKKQNKTDEYMLNYNGFTGRFEFLHDGKVYELDDRNYDEIEIAECTPSTEYSSKFATTPVHFVKGLNPKDRNNFQILVHADDNITVFKEFFVKISTSENTGSGRGIVKTDFFNNRIVYSLVKDGEINKLRLNKKSIESSFDNPQVASFIKKSKLKFNSEQDLKQLLAYYRDTIVPQKTSSDPVVTKKTN